MSFEVNQDYQEKFENAKDQREFERLQKEYDDYYAQKQQLFKLGDFEIGMTIGQGAFGCVKRCVHKDTGFVVALKIYQKSQMQSEAQIVALNEEIAVL